MPTDMVQTLRFALPRVMAAVILALIYSVVQLNDENTELREKDILQATRLCLLNLDDAVFTHSGYVKLGAGKIRVSCYYSKGEQK